MDHIARCGVMKKYSFSYCGVFVLFLFFKSMIKIIVEWLLGINKDSIWYTQQNVSMIYRLKRDVGQKFSYKVIFYT